MNLIYTNTSFQRSPVPSMNAGLFPYDTPAFSRFRTSSEEPRSPFLPTHAQSPFATSERASTNGHGHSPPPPLLEKMRRGSEKSMNGEHDSVFAGSESPALSSPFARVFDYNWMNYSTGGNDSNNRKPSFDNNGSHHRHGDNGTMTNRVGDNISASYEALMKANYEKMRFSQLSFRRTSPPASTDSVVVSTSAGSPSPLASSSSTCNSAMENESMMSASSSPALARSPTKARMKYTPVRENPFDRHSPSPHNNGSNSNGSARSPNMFLSSARITLDERKPYHRIAVNGNGAESDLVRSMNLHSTMKYDMDARLFPGNAGGAPLSSASLSNIHRLHNNHHPHHPNNKVRHFSESLLNNGTNTDNKSRSPSSAFSVIRPHFHRMYSTESGYSSDPSSSTHKLFKPYETFEKSKILSRRHSENHLKQEFNSSRSSNNLSTSSNGSSNGSTDMDKEIAGVSKLHVSDEASKEALKAFDAHVEKIMAEKTRAPQQQSNLGSPSLSRLADSPRHIALTSSNHPMQLPPSSSSAENTAPLKSTSELSHSVGGLLGLTRIANEHLGQAIAKEKKRSKSKFFELFFSYVKKLSGRRLQDRQAVQNIFYYPLQVDFWSNSQNKFLICERKYFLR